MRIFKWTPTFTPMHESSVVPIWVCFPKLLAHLFRKEALFSVASMVGSPLQIDALTLNKSKLSQARVCVEIDLLKPIIEKFDLHINGVTIIQKVIFEQLSEYCSLCKHMGHKDSDCFSKGQKVTASVGRPIASQIFERSKVEAEYSKDNNPEKRDKVQQGAATLESTSHTTLMAQGENYINNMDNFNLDDPLMAELLDRDWEAEKNFDSSSKTTFYNKEAILEASEIEAQGIQESSDKEEAVTPIFSRFQSLEDSNSLLELNLELQVIPYSIDSTPDDYMHDQGLDSGILLQP
ncbi:UNVERIFIED_CONTAM: hypothetical protein Scaly_2632300 [Sesamum calycinum]|uniref:DUF4283 domain-containing protein n=1 Tax=Sesamum calycinum TaxID=2727403 RepID=A0AAW2JAM6_9LAMI